MIQVTYWGSMNIRHHCARFSQVGDLAPGICALLFITVLTGAISEPNESIPQPHIHFYIFQVILSFRSPHAFFFSYTRYIPCPAHLPCFYSPINIWWNYKSWSSSLFSILHPLATSSLLGPNIFHSTLFFNPLNLYSSSNVTYQVSHPHETEKCIVLL